MAARSPAMEDDSRRAARTRLIPRSWWTALAFALLFALLAYRLVHQRTPFVEDDAAFFFRYAQNIADGHGWWRWNPEEPPVWGASAPFWPVFVASGIRVGLTQLQSAMLWSVIFSSLAAALVGWVAHRRFGPLGVVALAPLLAINHHFSTWATSCMESPMTFACIGAALLVADGVGGGALLGAVAGACMVHKLDLAPLGVALLVGAFLTRRPGWVTSLALASAIALAWYGFAWLYFGSPLPNSFLRKLTFTYGDLPHSWFASHALTGGGGPVRLALIAIGLVVLRQRRFLLGIALTAVLVPTLAYTLRPPSEGFMWYAAAVSPAVAFLAAAGLGAILVWLSGDGARPARSCLAALPAVVIAAPLHVMEEPRIRNWHEYLNTVEPVFISTGTWIDHHTSPDARVLGFWGHLALASHRFFYDGTFLNRPPEDRPLQGRQPEVFVSGNPPSPAETYRGYHVARVFTAPTPGWRTAPYCVVYLRDDVRILGDPDAPLGPGLSSGEPPPVTMRSPADLAREILRALLQGDEPQVIAEPKVLRLVQVMGRAWTKRLDSSDAAARARALRLHPGLVDLRARIERLARASSGAAAPELRARREEGSP